MNDPFNPKQFRGKKTVYITVPSQQGVAAIWDWNEQRKKYVRRTEGLQYYAFKKSNGRQESKCFTKLDEARAWRTSSFYIDAAPEGMTFLEAKRRYFERAKGRIQVTTQETYLSCSKHLAFFDAIPVSQITSKVVDAWLTAIKKAEYLELQHSNRMTYHQELSVLRQIFVYYSEYEDESYQLPLKRRHLQDAIVDSVTFRLSQDRNRSKFIPRKDFVLWLGELDRRANMDPKLRVYWALGWFQTGGGLRIGEACAVRFDDVLDWDSGAVSISKNVQWSRMKGRSTRISPLTKTGDSRTVFLSNEALSVLRRWKDLCGRSTGLIFSEDGLNPLGYRSVQFVYDKAFKTLALPWKGTHIARHSYATDFLERTGNKAALQGQLGHRTSRQTDHYAKITATTQQAGVRAYNESLRGGNVVELHPKNEPATPDRLGEAGNEEASES